MWVANFGPLKLGDNFRGRLTKLWGIHPPPGHNVGDPISPPTGYTLPTAAAKYYCIPECHCTVTVHRQGHLLHTNDSTALGIDQAGNIWSINNWKPDFGINTLCGNPGGHGIIIFVGLAPPPTIHVD